MTGTTTSAVWDRVVSSLSQDPAGTFNTATEACERWSADRSKLALIIRHADGSTERWTYFALGRESARAARVLRAAGLSRGDRVAGLLGRQSEAWITALAAWRSGLVYVPLFGGFGTDAIAQRLQAAGVRHVVVDQRYRSGLEAARGRLAFDIEVICVDNARGSALRQGDRSFWSEIARADPLPAVETSGGDTATMMFTSGTTSIPKACVIPHRGLVALIPFIEHCMALDRRDLLFCPADPGWSYGLYTTGAAVMALGVPRLMYSGDFDPYAWLNVIDAEQATYMGGAPSAYRRLVPAAERRGMSSSIRGANSAGEALDQATADGWSRVTGTSLRDAYGLSELGMVLGNPAYPASEVPAGGLAGPVPGFEMDLVDEHGRVVDGPDAIGTIAIRRPAFQLATDYANAPQAWQDRWIDDRFVTGDVARQNADGTVFFVGRSDDVIVTSGYNVGPAEVESVLLDHPSVADAAAVAEPDTARGMVVRAVVVCASGVSGSDALTAELRKAVRSGVGVHAEPRQIDFVDALPRTETGKLRRSALRR